MNLLELRLKDNGDGLSSPIQDSLAAILSSIEGPYSMVLYDVSSSIGDSLHQLTDLPLALPVCLICALLWQGSTWKALIAACFLFCHRHSPLLCSQQGMHSGWCVLL
jgi:hypothetical protein